MSVKTKHPDVVTLDYERKGGKVVIKPENRDIFLTTVEEAINALCLRDKEQGLNAAVHNMLDYLADWVGRNAGKIKDAYVTVRDGGLLFLVVRKQTRFDREFEESMTDLDLAVARDDRFKGIPLSVLPLPLADEGTVAGFLHSSSFRIRHGK